MIISYNCLYVQILCVTFFIYTNIIILSATHTSKLFAIICENKEIILYPLCTFVCELILLNQYVCVWLCLILTVTTIILIYYSHVDMSLWSHVGNSALKRDPTSSSWCLLSQPIRHVILQLVCSNSMKRMSGHDSLTL